MLWTLQQLQCKKYERFISYKIRPDSFCHFISISLFHFSNSLPPVGSKSLPSFYPCSSVEFHFIHCSKWSLSYFGVFFCLLNYNADERCRIDNLERSQEATCYRHPVVLPLGFCAKAGCESFSFSFLFNLADPFFLVNHFTSLHVKYWSRGQAHTHTQI